MALSASLTRTVSKRPCLSFGESDKQPLAPIRHWWSLTRAPERTERTPNISAPTATANAARHRDNCRRTARVRRYVDMNEQANPCASFAVSNATAWRAATTGAPAGRVRMRRRPRAPTTASADDRERRRPRAPTTASEPEPGAGAWAEIFGRKSLGAFLKLKLLGRIFRGRKCLGGNLWAEIFGRKIFGRKIFGRKMFGRKSYVRPRRRRFVFRSVSRMSRATSSGLPLSWASMTSSDGSTPCANLKSPHQRHSPTPGYLAWRGLR
jgi:hypothetical protein